MIQTAYPLHFLPPVKSPSLTTAIQEGKVNPSNVNLTKWTFQSFKPAASQTRRLESTFRSCSPAAILLVNLNLPFIKSFLSSPYIGICDGEDEAFMYCMGGEL